ncbi:MAG: carbohydrate kinase, partial [Tissierellia bacterium]|nr:carbohydrate kinase [Tissierellia bacterium]
MDGYVIAYDFGTTGLKTCVFEISDSIRLIASTMEGYELHIVGDGGAEQDPNDWWNAMINTTKDVLLQNDISKEDIKGISFCAQMQGLVLVDKDGKPVRPAMSYMDNRAWREMEENIAHGPQVAGVNVFKLLKSIRITGAVSA